MENIKIPKILECSRYVTKCNGVSRRTVKDYELDFYVDGTRKMIIDNEEFSISTGSLVFRKPGQYVESIGDYNCYTLTFDISNSVNIPPNQYTRTHSLPFQPIEYHILLNDFPTVFIPNHYQEIKDLYKKINANTYPFPENETKTKSYFKELLFIISADIVAATYKTDKISQTDEYIQKVYKYINSNYMNDISIKDIAKKICINQNYLNRIFKERNNSTPNQYLNEVRLFHAKKMLIDSSLKTSEIAFECGYNNPAYFAECFKKRFSKTPTEYRKEISNL